MDDEARAALEAATTGPAGLEATPFVERTWPPSPEDLYG